MITLADVKKKQREYRKNLATDKDVENWGYLTDWKRSPYSCLKAWFYQEAGAVLAYFLLKTRITPNAVTITYGLLGLAGGILLAAGARITVIAAALIFFFKSVLDWSDGLLAKLQGKTSITGDMLDRYGGSLGAWALPIGLGFYVAQKSGMMFYYYLIPLYLLFAMGKLHSYAFYVLYKEYITPERVKAYRKNTSGAASDGLSAASVPQKIHERLERYVGHRAHTVDFICLVLLVEAFTHIFVSWVIFLVFVAKEFLTFCASFYVVAGSGWAEKEVSNKLDEISGTFADEKSEDVQKISLPKE